MTGSQTVDRPLRILILEDVASDAELMECELRDAGFTFTSRRVMTEDAYLRELMEFSPDVILSDYDLPRYSGTSALAESRVRCPDVPFILVTGAIGEEKAIDTLLSGATDYVLKHRLSRLGPAVRRALAEVDEHRARRQAEEELRKSAEEIYDLYNNAPCGYHSLSPDGTFLRVNDTVLSWLGYERDQVTGRMKFPDILTAESRKLFSRSFPVFKERGWIHDLEFEVVRKDGTTMPVLMSATAIRDGEGRYLMSRSTLYDVTDRKRTEDELTRLNQLYSVLSKMNEAILRIRDLDELYRVLCRIAVEEGMFRMAWVGFADSHSCVKPAAWFGVEDGYLQDIRISLDKIDVGLGPTGTAVREGTFDVCNDWDEDPRMEPWRKEGKKRGYRSSGAFPLRKGNRIVGAMTFYAGAPHYFTADKISLLVSMAENLSFAIQTAEQEGLRRKAEQRLRTAHRKLRDVASEMIRTEERERQHIATVLHDTIAQTLAATKMRYESVMRRYISPDGLQSAEEIRELLQLSIRQARSMMAELSPPILYELGFIPAMEWLSEQFETRHGISVEFAVQHGPPILPHDIQVLLYQATRELLTNVVKHAGATKARVVVEQADRKVRIEVSDDGIGMDKSKMGYQGDLSGGFGLFSIRERLKHFGGELAVQSGGRKGTKIVLTVPC